MTERSQTAMEGMCSPRGEDAPAILTLSRYLPPRSLYSPFLLAGPYKAGIVGDMNATIQQNEINNAPAGLALTGANVPYSRSAYIRLVYTYSTVHNSTTLQSLWLSFAD